MEGVRVAVSKGVKEGVEGAEGLPVAVNSAAEAEAVGASGVAVAAALCVPVAEGRAGETVPRALRVVVGVALWQSVEVTVTLVLGVEHAVAERLDSRLLVGEAVGERERVAWAEEEAETEMLGVGRAEAV